MNATAYRKTPGIDADERVLLYALKEYGRLGPKTILGLLARFETAATLFVAEADDILAVPNIGEKTLEAITTATGKIANAERDLKRYAGTDVAVTDITAADFPEPLHHISDPPILLYRRGTAPDLTKPTIGIIGTTEPTDDAKAEAVDWGRVVAENDGIVVSGLARGIDGAAHTGCLIADGFNIAVLGCGFGKLYPPEHESLAREIVETGCLLSESRPALGVNKTRLVLRNRLIAALSDATVIVQLSETSSGSQETARRAAEFGKPVFVCTAHGNSEAKKLLATGAYPVDSPDDFPFVLELARV